MAFGSTATDPYTFSRFCDLFGQSRIQPVFCDKQFSDALYAHETGLDVLLAVLYPTLPIKKILIIVSTGYLVKSGNDSGGLGF